MKNAMVWMALCAAVGACTVDDGTPVEAPSEPVESMDDPGELPEADPDPDPDPAVDETDPVEDPMKPDDGVPDETEPVEEPAPSYGEWVVAFGGIDADIVEDVAADDEGNVFVAGTFREEITIGDTTLNAMVHEYNPTTDVFVASFSPTGEFRWATAFGSTESEKPFGIEVAPDGGVFVVGDSQGPLSFGSSYLPHKGQSDLFAVKFDSDGEYQWSQSWGGQFSENPRAIAVNEAGDLFITGSWQGLFTAGDRTYSAHNDWAAMDVIVLAIDGSSGAVKWSNSFFGFLMETGTAISADSAGNVVVGISYQYDIDVNGEMFEVGEEWQSLLVKIDSNGDVVWAEHYGAEGNVANILGVELAEDGSVYGTGVFSGKLNLGGVDLLNDVRGHDTFVFGLEADGTHRFSESFGGEGFDQPLDLVARGDEFFITGRYDGELQFADTLLTAQGGYDIFVAAFEQTTGALAWARSFGGPEDDQANGVAVDGGRGVYVAGYNDGGDFMFNDMMQPAASPWLDAVVLRLEE